MASNKIQFSEHELEDSPNTINILLLGETGVGKSTFINSFANYIQSSTFQEALKTKPIMLIPTRITVYDENTMEDHSIVIGSDKNEKQDVGASCTQGVQTYLFPIEGDNIILRLIDTPGIGDTGGPDQDDRNCEEILAYLAQLNKLNAICLLMKPSHDRSTILFSYCFRRIFSQLHKSASDNVIFMFTNTKGSDYRAGGTLPILKKMTEEIASEPPNVRIPIGPNNVFCLDNESFKYLLAIGQNIAVGKRIIESCNTSWKISCDEILRFIEHIQKLTPHNVKQTICINNTRELILQLSKPLSDICQLLQENILNLKVKEQESTKTNQTIEELKKKLYKPGVDLKIIKLDHSVTVCTNLGCVESIQVGGTTKFNYKRRCHNPCLLGSRRYEVIGHWSLTTCSEMTWSLDCKHCKCSYKKHMTISYDTEIVEKQYVDEDVQSNLLSEEKERKKIDKIINDIKQEKKELESEMEFVTQCAARFAYYLQNNAITSSFDSFKEYIYLSLERQKSLGQKADMELVASLSQILARHENLVKTLTAKPCRASQGKITEESIYKDVEELFKLKHMGGKIKEIFDARAACAKNGLKATFKAMLTKSIPNWFLGSSKKS